MHTITARTGASVNVTCLASSCARRRARRSRCAACSARSIVTVLMSDVGDVDMSDVGDDGRRITSTPVGDAGTSTGGVVATSGSALAISIYGHNHTCA
jgi:hypothetical protein